MLCGYIKGTTSHLPYGKLFREWWREGLSWARKKYELKLIMDHLPLHFCRSQLGSHWKFILVPPVTAVQLHVQFHEHSLSTGNHTKLYVATRTQYLLKCYYNLQQSCYFMVTTVVWPSKCSDGKDSCSGSWYLSKPYQPPTKFFTSILWISIGRIVS